MESNTPPAIQRNRRAGRVSALPPEQPLIIPPAQPQQPPAAPQAPAAPVQSAAQTAWPAQQPAPAFRQEQTYIQPGTYRQPAGTAPVNPYARPQQPYADGLNAAHPRPRIQQLPGAASYMPQPTARPAARNTQRPASRPLERPTPSVDPRALRRDDPEVRRAAALERRRSAQPAPAREKPVREEKPRAAKIPSWMWTLTSVMIIGVLALVAFSTLMQAYLKTAADEKQKARSYILSEYHLTEQPDGTLRVTWQDVIEHYAAIYNLDPAFVTAIIRNESSFRTNAESGVGARGLMQMMPDTAEWIAGKLGESYDFDRLYDADTSIRYGCWYLNYLSQLFQGDPILVCAAYHAGQGEVWGWLGNTSISPDGVTVPIDNIPIRETKTYAGRVTQAYGIYNALLYPETPSDAAALRSADRADDLLPAAGR